MLTVGSHAGEIMGRAFQDAYNISLTGGASDPEEAALRIIEGGQVPRPTLISYLPSQHVGVHHDSGCRVGREACEVIFLYGLILCSPADLRILERDFQTAELRLLGT